MPTRAKLDSVRSLTFYKDSRTDSRRGSYLPQLNCIGKPCSLYTPDVVRCRNAGGSGTDVDWKCEADLPEALRFGRVEVSCEGWNGPGDAYIMKESCSLDYRLVEVPAELRGNHNPLFPRRSTDLASTLFSMLWFAVLAFIVYSFYQSCRRPAHRDGDPGSGTDPGSGGRPGFFGGTNHPDNQPPPPYSKSANAPGVGPIGWQPGFWTGAMTGVGVNMLNNYWQQNRNEAPRRRAWDWERDTSRTRPAGSAWTSVGNSGVYGSRWDDDDRGEGSSRSGGLGSMRSSTGLGGSNVR